MNCSRAALLAIAAVPFVVFAAETSHPAAATAPAKELAHLLVPKETWAAGVDQITANVQQQLLSHPGANLRYPADFPQKVRAEVEKIVPYDEFVSMHATQLSTAFSDSELKDVLAFYRSPTGQKWQRDLPKTSQPVAAETQKRFSERMPEVMSRLGAMAQSSDAGTSKSAGTPHGHPTPEKSSGK
jgi:hypothetical protein